MEKIIIKNLIFASTIPFKYLCTKYKDITNNNAKKAVNKCVAVNVKYNKIAIAV